ncbi:MAG: hypothetical protein L0Y44_13235 [Phycisphaerales bacterium]|nr:hypothetical protein [Phycisphaerales bacterium]MCI0674507.1 hypothetical protein [Phycisphaerales bacterium]
MKSTEVYKLIREVIGPWCKEQGFKRTTGGMLGWHRPHADQQLVFWFQCSQDGWDPYTGSKFILEFQVAGDPQPGASGARRYRLPYFLSEAELEEVRAIQNSVIAGLPPPPKDYYVFGLGAATSEWYRGKFQPVPEPYRNQDDIWLRYHTPADVRRWADFVLAVLPTSIRAAGGPA